MVTPDKVIPTSCDASPKVIPAVGCQEWLPRVVAKEKSPENTWKHASCIKVKSGQGLLPGVVVFFWGARRPAQIFPHTRLVLHGEGPWWRFVLRSKKILRAYIISLSVSGAAGASVDLSQSRWVIRCLWSLVDGLRGVDRTMASQQQLAVPRVALRMWFRDFFANVAGVFAKFFRCRLHWCRLACPPNALARDIWKIWRNSLLWGQNAGASTYPWNDGNQDSNQAGVRC